MPRLIGSPQRLAGMLALPAMGLLWLLLGAAIRNKIYSSPSSFPLE